MKHPIKSQQSGFTLVEIAIVLVIIGLLLGGVLKGQELITNARVRNVIDQSNGINAAFFAFQDRFRLLPGDLTVAGTATVGNGALVATAAPGNGAVLLSDSATLFQNLASAGFISCGICTASGASTAANSPSNTFGGPMSFGASNDYQFGAAAGVARMRIATGNQIPSNITAEIDRKIDDGVSNSGTFVESSWFGGLAACAVGNPGVWAAAGAGAQTNCGGASLL